MLSLGDMKIKSSIIWKVFLSLHHQYLLERVPAPTVSHISFPAHSRRAHCKSSLCGANATNQLASSCSCLCRRPQVFSCGARDLHRAAQTSMEDASCRLVLNTSSNPEEDIHLFSSFGSTGSALARVRRPAAWRNLCWSVQPAGDSVTAVFVVSNNWSSEIAG